MFNAKPRGVIPSGFCYFRRFHATFRPPTHSLLFLNSRAHPLAHRGDERVNSNNHPIRAGKVIGTHNGTIYNADYPERKGAEQ